MGIISILIATVIIILLLVFANSPFSPLHKGSSQLNGKQIEQNAQDTVNSAVEKTKLEQGQVKNIDLPNP